MRSAVLALLAVSHLYAQVAAVPPLVGNWTATIESGASQIRLVFHFSRGPNGALSGTIDSPDQLAIGLPLGSVTLVGNSVRVELAAPPVIYSGTLNAAATEITGTWKQGPVTVPVTFHRDVSSAASLRPNRPQEPKGPFPYRNEDVNYPSKAPGVQLAGTLTLPSSGGPFPAVLLVTGSGPQDRDESIVGHRPFWVIADYLTRHGIAVLRVDDRGIAKSTGDFAKSTTADFVDDAAGSLAYLTTRREIDRKHIGVIGHSEGAIVAPLLANRIRDVSFIVMMAGTAVNGREVLKAQAAAIARAAGANPAGIQQNADLQERIFDALDSQTDPVQLNAQLQTIAKQALDKLPPEQRAAAEPRLQAQLREAASPWFRYFVKLDPAVALRQLKVPVLALDGSLDLQVVTSQNLPAIVKALEDGGNPDYEIVKFPNLNHLFQTAKTGSPAEYANIPETIAPVVLYVMTNWILRHTAPHPNGS